MKNGVKQMQGVSAYIETHYEALAYCQQEKKICHYREHGKCSNHESIQCDGICIGYTKCADFISDVRYNEKLTKMSRMAVKKEQNKIAQDTIYSKHSKNKNEIRKTVAEKRLSDNTLGSDPKLRAVFEQIKNK